MQTKPAKKKLVVRVILGVVSVVLLCALAFGLVEFWYLPHYISKTKVFDVTQLQKAEGEVSVMSCNVRLVTPFDTGKKSWLYRANIIIDNIAENAPDIIGFQEVTAPQQAYLTKTLQGYASVVQYRDNAFLSEAGPIYYRTDVFKLIDEGSFWLSETPDVMSKDWGAACYRICSYVILEEIASGVRFVVFNTHLDHVSDEARVKGIGVVLSFISKFGGIPAILMGDLNAEEDSVTYKMATEHFVDARYEAKATMESVTYQGFGEQESELIDYIMVSPGSFEVMEYKVVTKLYDGVYPSDHFPIYASMKFV